MHRYYAYVFRVTPAVVVDCGHDSITIAAVIHGIILRTSIVQLDFGGRDLTDYLSKCESGLSLNGTEGLIIDHIKRSLGYVALNFAEELEKNPSVSYEWPTGEKVPLVNVHFCCTEPLFEPSLIGRQNTLGIHQAILRCINKCDPSLHTELYANIILAGGTSSFPGLKPRLQAEITTISPVNTLVQVNETDGQYSSWTGGAMLGSEPDFDSRLLRVQEYSETGPGIVHRFFPH